MPPARVVHLPPTALTADAPSIIDHLNREPVGGITCEIESLPLVASLLVRDRKLSLLGAALAIDVRSTLDDEQTKGLLRSLAAMGARLLLLRLFSSDSHDKPSAPRAMAPAAALVTRLSKLAATQGITLALDPQAGLWMARIEDAVRVAMRVNRANVGVVFSLADWLATDGDTTLLRDRLKLALPKLLLVALPPAGDAAGEHLLMQSLREMGYTGPLLSRSPATT